MFQKYLKKKGLPSLGDPIDNPVIEKRVKKDIPVLGDEGMHLLERTGTFMSMVVNCPECRKCVKVCPNDAITIDEEKRTIIIATDVCEGVHCQRCLKACPPDKFNWKTLKAIKPQQNL
jgi:ferredoxin